MINKTAKAAEARRYYAGIDIRVLNKTILELENRFVDDCVDLTLINGISIHVERDAYGNVTVKDVDSRITSEFRNDDEDAMIKAVIFLTQLSKQKRL